MSAKASDVRTVTIGAQALMECENVAASALRPIDGLEQVREFLVVNGSIDRLKFDNPMVDYVVYQHRQQPL